MTSKNKTIDVLMTKHEIRVHDSWHELLDGLALYYNQISGAISVEEFAQIACALTNVKGVVIDEFACRVGLPDDLIRSWLTGEVASDSEIRKLIIDKLFQYARSQIHPCSPKYQYPGAVIHNGWVLPSGVTLKTRLTMLSGWKQLDTKYQKVMTEIKVSTVGEYLSDLEAPKQVKGISLSRNMKIKDVLLGQSGFRKIDQKLLSAR